MTSAASSVLSNICKQLCRNRSSKALSSDIADCLGTYQITNFSLESIKTEWSSNKSNSLTQQTVYG